MGRYKSDSSINMSYLQLFSYLFHALSNTRPYIKKITIFSYHEYYIVIAQDKI